MNAEIIAVGTELLLGQIVNTNARFLSKQCAEMGINVFFHTVVGDNPLRLKSVLEIAEKRSDLIIFTGGLGPTKDDVTKEVVSAHVKKQLIVDDDALQSIETYFKRTNRTMTANNRKQALVIEGAAVLKNDYGMAPGMLFEKNKRLYMLLPGPPKELEPMFLTYGRKTIESKQIQQAKIVSKVLRFFGIGESLLETEIADLIDGQSNPTIAPLAGDGEVTLRITAKVAGKEGAEQLIAATENLILARVGEYFYGYDETTLMNELFQKLRKNKFTIAAAESLTGGMFQQELTSLSGASSVLKGGIVCYTNEVKIQTLHVNEKTILQKGAVSKECAAEMAENVRHLLKADIGISFTGVAGPGESEGKPAGTVYIGISQNGMPTIVKKLSLAGSRNGNRQRTVKYGCFLLLKSFAQKNGQ
ncbi:competence/damage-inducible protein A [Bacillaceae bacterium Marseille-Q3522]|nr:competence/damage-inducible protein A [Bacillaceae bacterium Marseille-Q3522]